MSFTVIFIVFLLFYKNKYYLEVHLDNCIYKVVERQIIDYLSEFSFETDEESFLLNRPCKCFITIELIYGKKLMLLKVITVKNV